MSKAILRRGCVILLLTAALVTAVLSASAAPMKAQSAGNYYIVGRYGVERLLVGGNTPPEQFFPSIYGNLVAYEEGTGSGDNNVKLFDISKGTATTISDASTVSDWRPRIWGNRVVWMGYTAGSWDIFWYDIAAKQVHRLTTQSAYQAWPEINGDRVVWQDNRNGDDDIYMYDFKTGKETRITSNPAAQREPCISGDRIMWQDLRNGNWDIYWYDIAKKQEYRLTTSTLNDVNPDVWGTRAAYVRDNAGDLDVFFVKYFDATGYSQTVMGATVGTDQDRPRLHGDMLLYHSDTTGDFRISYYIDGMIAQGAVSARADNEYEPQMWGNLIVHHDDRGGNLDLYVTELLKPSLTLSAPGATAYNGTTSVSGYLKRASGAALASRAVKVQYILASALPGGSWTTLPATTDSGGKFSAKIPALPTRFYVRALFEGDEDVWYASSPQRTVLPKVSLTKPTGKKSISNTKSYTYYGYLKPQYTAGSQRVWIKCYRKSGGKYRLKKTFTTTLADYDSSTSKYSRKIKLKTEGKWRIRAQFKSTTDHAETYSDYKYIRVY